MISVYITIEIQNYSLYRLTDYIAIKILSKSLLPYIHLFYLTYICTNVLFHYRIILGNTVL